MPGFAAAILGIIFIIIGVTMTLSKKDLKMNMMVGYRTKRSMASEEAWISANRFFNRCFIVCGIIDIIIGGIFWLDFSVMSIITNGVVVFLGLGISIYLTESHLKKKFNNGQ